MKADELAAEFARILALDAVFAGTAFRTAHDDAEQTFPAIAVTCDVRPLDTQGRCLGYEAKFMVETHSADDEGATPPDTAHAARVSLLHAKFFGSTAGDLAAARAAMTSAFASGGKFTLAGYDIAPPGEQQVDDSRFRTDFVVRGIALVTGAI